MRAARFLLAVLVVLVAGCADGSRNTGSAPAAAPDFEVETFERTTFHLAEHRGTPVVLNFWESW